MLRRPFAWLMAMMGALIALLTAIHLVQIPLRIPLNYNEGWMALLSDRAVGGGVLYPAPGLFVVDNYPPLSFYVIGAVGRLLGDNVAAGRCVALAALAAVTCEVLWSARRLDAGKGAAALGALLFALSNLTWFHAYVAMADPQWLGQAVTLAGLPLLLQAGDGRLRLGPVIASAVLMTAGGFIKHNLIALPLATALWLAVEDRRAFLAWSATAVVALGAGGSAAPLGKIIADGRFGAMVLTRDAAFLQGEGRLPAPIPARIEAAYAVRLSGPRGTVLMTPRRP